MREAKAATLSETRETTREHEGDMGLRRRREMYYENRYFLPKDVPMCINCWHFFQHYVKTDSLHCAPIDWGHCSFPRLKYRKAFDLCRYFSKVDDTP